jgi:hypothetical protein
LLTEKNTLSSSGTPSSGPRYGEEPRHVPSGASSGLRYEDDPRAVAIEYYSTLKARAEAAREFVSLLKRTNKRKYQSDDDACNAIKEEIEIQGDKYQGWLQIYKLDSGLLDIYNSPEIDIKRYCDDIDNCITGMYSILESADTYDQKAFSDQMVKLDKLLFYCSMRAQKELEKFRIIEKVK